MRSVVITGASTGIGLATTKLLTARGYSVFGSVRKMADAERLSRELGANFTPLLFDVTDEAAVLESARQVRAALNGQTLAGLVNNAIRPIRCSSSWLIDCRSGLLTRSSPSGSA